MTRSRLHPLKSPTRVFRQLFAARQIPASPRAGEVHAGETTIASR
jgi:hypothetical protein